VPDLHASRKPQILKQHSAWHRAYINALGHLRRRGIVVLLGPRGLGKTQIGVEAIRVACRHLRLCKYSRCAELFSDIRSTYKQDTRESERVIIERYAKAYMLCLDEGQERRGSAFESTQLTLLIDIRYGKRLPTVIIANTTEAEFRDAWGDSVSSRLDERGMFIQCDWESFR
jgi:DNA replication protein DnaC